MPVDEQPGNAELDKITEELQEVCLSISVLWLNEFTVDITV